MSYLYTTCSLTKVFNEIPISEIQILPISDMNGRIYPDCNLLCLYYFTYLMNLKILFTFLPKYTTTSVYDPLCIFIFKTVDVFK